MRIRSMSACLAVTAVAAGMGPASASGATITFDEPVAGAVVSDCTGETVLISGTMHNKVTDNSSLTSLKSQIEMNLTGVKGTTASGVRYVMNDQTTDVEHADFDPFGNAQITVENTTNLTRAGETGALLTGDDFRLHVLTHLTISNGRTTAESHDLRADCR